MVRDHHRAMMQTSNAQANLAHRYLRAALNHVIADIDEDEEPILQYNPVDRLGKLHQWADVDRRDTVIPRDKIGLWVDALMTGLTGLKHDAELRDVLTFLLFTGARRSEIIGDPKIPDKEPLRWSQVDFGRQEVTFLNTKIGNDHVLPIGSCLTKMLADRKKISRSEFVFADSDGVVPTDLRAAFTRLHKLTNVRISAHDLRRTFISAAELSVGIPEMIVRKLTNHATGSKARADAHAGYLSVETMDTRQAIQKIENWILEQPIARESKAAGVVPLRSARA
jgi:integrase